MNPQGAAQRVTLVVRATAAGADTTEAKAATTCLCKIGTRGRYVGVSLMRHRSAFPDSRRPFRGV